ncbi:hypothetical protein B0H13DRAFT_1862138 [Mycena leptocephala]|nr:hypothetical protein B0H13DRAFT_1862138 [Mycena leptocephala]
MYMVAIPQKIRAIHLKSKCFKNWLWIRAGIAAAIQSCFSKCKWRQYTEYSRAFQNVVLAESTNFHLAGSIQCRNTSRRDGNDHKNQDYPLEVQALQQKGSRNGQYCAETQADWLEMTAKIIVQALQKTALGPWLRLLLRWRLHDDSHTQAGGAAMPAICTRPAYMVPLGMGMPVPGRVIQGEGANLTGSNGCHSKQLSSHWKPAE